MKIVNFSAGLGNQIFQFAFYRSLQIRYPKSKVFGYYNRHRLTKHNGFELCNAFSVSPPPSTFLSNFVTDVIRLFRKVGMLKWAIAHDDKGKSDTLLYDGWWQDKNLFDFEGFSIDFNIRELSSENRQLLSMISSGSSVFVHVRRGDYVSPQFSPIYGGICGEDYYTEALNVMSEKFTHPAYFVFSDDIEWVKMNLKISNAIFIDWNRGRNSYLDMYLMSNCAGGIIANSTFSYWAAKLGVRSKQVIYPITWVNRPHAAPNIFPNEWIGI
jgi:hypothetical protein